MVLYDPERTDDIGAPHAGEGADRLGPSAVRELNDDLPVGISRVYVRRRVLPRRQEDYDLEPGDSQDGGHHGNLTQRMGCCNRTCCFR